MQGPQFYILFIKVKYTHDTGFKLYMPYKLCSAYARSHAIKLKPGSLLWKFPCLNWIIQIYVSQSKRGRETIRETKWKNPCRKAFRFLYLVKFTLRLDMLLFVQLLRLTLAVSVIMLLALSGVQRLHRPECLSQIRDRQAVGFISDFTLLSLTSDHLP